MAQSFAFASGNSCFTNSLVQKHKISACAEFLDSLLCFVAQSFVLWHRAWVCDTELWFVTQSSEKR